MVSLPATFLGLFHIASLPAEAQFSAASELYTQNAICVQKNCVNPLFPGLIDLPRLEQVAWQCSDRHTARQHLDFCKQAVLYDPALPVHDNSSMVAQLVKAQDDAALTMYFFHLNALGYDVWYHKKPDEGTDECVRNVWRMACFTYFPRAEESCQIGQESTYLRPCMGSCLSYLQACSVECCDESPQCVFHHTMIGDDGRSLVQTGYVDKLGPSTTCTGSIINGSQSRRGGSAMLLFAILGLHLFATMTESAGPVAVAATGKPNHKSCRGRSPTWLLKDAFVKCLLVSALVVCTLSLHGCEVDVPHHTLGNWRSKVNYLVTFQFLEPGQPQSAARLNSCADPTIPETLQCSGHGYCHPWNEHTTVQNPISFCICETDWADPECRTRRKSQTTAYLCSLFGGFLGIDYFYLGFKVYGLVKLVTFGGLGIWWMVDIIRTGAGPIYAHNYRVANDLPHWVFVLSASVLFLLLGFVFSLESYLQFRKTKRDDVLKMQQSEEARHLSKLDELDGPRFRSRVGPPQQDFENRQVFTGYGSTLPGPHPNAGAPYVLPGTSIGPPFYPSPGPAYSAPVPGPAYSAPMPGPAYSAPMPGPPLTSACGFSGRMGGPLH